MGLVDYLFGVAKNCREINRNYAAEVQPTFRMKRKNGVLKLTPETGPDCEQTTHDVLEGQALAKSTE